MARALSDTSARILILERGDFVPQEKENWDPEAVWRQLRYRTTERWLDGRGQSSRRTHTTAWAGTPSSGAACSTVSGGKISAPPSTPTAFLPHGRSTTTPSNPTMTAPNACITSAARKASIRRNRRAGPTRTGRFRMAPKWRRSSQNCGIRDSILRRCLWGSFESAKTTAAFCATRATRSSASFTRRARLTYVASVRRSAART